MAVQAQYTSNAVFATRGEQERKDVDFQPLSAPFLDHSPVLFNNGGTNSRKRVREAMVGGVATSPMMTVGQVQSNRQFSPLVSTGLCLAFDDHRQSNPLLSTSNTTTTTVNNNNFSSSLLSDDLAAQINQQKLEIEQLIAAQGEQLRRSLAEKRQRHLRALLSAAEESSARRLRETESKIERAAQRRAELEDRLTKLRAESMSWQMKAMAHQATAASLHAQLQYVASSAPAQTKTNGEEFGDSNRAEDAESAHVDPDRVHPARACRTCGVRAATMVLLPCRHLCVCEDCEAASGVVHLCPVCRAVRTGSVQVFLD